MSVHPNSIESIIQLKIGGKHNRVLSIFHKMGRPLTVREVKEIGKFNDMNEVRPRVNELIKYGRLEEWGTVKDPSTNRRVMRIRLIIRMDFFL